MDINENCEVENNVLELFIQPKPLPYPSSFKYKYRKQGRCLENFRSLWKEGEEEPPAPSFKRRKVEKLAGSLVLGQLDKDTLLFALSLLDVRSLIRCMLVERSLRRIIRSVELRRLWTQNQPPVVLISSYTLPCKLWRPGDGNSHTVFQPLLMTSAMVVASHRGLVCLRFRNSTEALDLAVGNPLIGEWVALPRSVGFGNLAGYSFTMEVGEAEEHGDLLVGFRVAAFSTDVDKHSCHIFDSASGEWSSTELFFPPRTTFKWSAFDLGSSSWRSHLIRDWNIKTGLERSPTEVHRLPHPRLHGFCRWEYKGSTFFASAWSVKQPYYDPKDDSAGEFAGYGVWKVVAHSKHGASECEAAEHLETVAAIWGPDAGASLSAIQYNIWMVGCGVKCYTADNLVWFQIESAYSPTMPVVFYDMDTGRWTSFDEQHPAPDPDLPGDHYAAAVVYSPSLLVAPARRGCCRKSHLDTSMLPEIDTEN